MAYEFEVFKCGKKRTYEFRHVEDLVEMKNELDKYLADKTFISTECFYGSFGRVYGDKCIITENDIYIYKDDVLVFTRNRHDNLWVRGRYGDGHDDTYMIMRDNQMLDIVRFNYLQDKIHDMRW